MRHTLTTHCNEISVSVGNCISGGMKQNSPTKSYLEPHSPNFWVIYILDDIQLSINFSQNMFSFMSYLFQFKFFFSSKLMSVLLTALKVYHHTMFMFFNSPFFPYVFKISFYFVSNVLFSLTLRQVCQTLLKHGPFNGTGKIHSGRINFTNFLKITFWSGDSGIWLK